MNGEWLSGGLFEARVDTVVTFQFLVEESDWLARERLHEDYNDTYWEQHYTICRERMPCFLEKSAQKILSTGKYLNVIRQCGEATWK